MGGYEKDSDHVGIALSSGGAAGLAHIGVVETLSEAGIEINHVAGTSAGAMVGAAFASDRLEGLRERVSAIGRRQLMALFDVSWTGGGIFAGRRAMALLEPFVGELIEDLPRRFAAVATDLASGAPVVLSSGPVLEAVRASIAIPGLFTPLTYEGRLLVDGALVDPIPVRTTRELGADFVIGVSVIPSAYAAPLMSACRKVEPDGFLSRCWQALPLWRAIAPPIPIEEEVAAVSRGTEVAGLSVVLARASVVVQAQIAAAQLRQHPPDFLIQPGVETIGVFDFHRAAEAIDAGRQAAREALPALRSAVAAARSKRRSALRRVSFSRQAA